MSEVQALLERSRSPGEFVERRRFTLSRDKAIEKLREFALRDPNQYVLELVQAAVFAEARWIAIDVTADRLLFAWVGGRPLPEAGLAGIFDYLFASQLKGETRHMAQLAIALNAILQRKPGLLRIESGDGTPEGTVRLDIDRSGEAVLGKPEQLLAGTYLLAEFSRGWLPRFGSSQIPREAALVEESCRYTPVPILLNGGAPFGYRASREFRLPGMGRQLAFDDGQRRGVFAAPAQSMLQGEIEIVVGGVRITTIEAAELTGGPHLIGVICDDGLRKTADQSDIVRDDAWLRMRHAIATPMTQAIHTRDPRYRPPRLEAIPAPSTPGSRIEAPPSLAPEPLPDGINRIGSAETYDVPGLLQVDPREPLFFINPETSGAAAASLDAAEFPYRVLVLTDGQALTLRGALPERSLSRLGGAADADFVRAALERRDRPTTVTLATSLDVDGSRVTGRLTLRHHGDAPLPGWGDPTDGPLPALIAYGHRAVVETRIPVHLGAVSVRFDLDTPPSHTGGLPHALTLALLDESWRLADALRAQEHPTQTGRYVGRLLGAVAEPQFVEDDGVTLQIGLPAAWPNSTRALLDQPLGGEPAITARELAALQGTAQVRPVGGLSELDALEQKLGFGHLSTPDLQGALVLAIGWTRRRWRTLVDWVPHADGRQDLDVQAAVVLLPTLASTMELPAGWRVERAVVPGILFVVHEALGDESPPWYAGLRQLYTAATRKDPSTLARGPISLRRARDRARMTRAQLHDRQDLVAAQLGGLPKTHPGIFHPSVRVLPRHGMPLLETGVVSFTLDELLVLQDRLGSRLQLRFDDPPSVWRSLLGDSDEGWLLRMEAHAPGLRAAVGLRVPYDATTGVLVCGSNGYVSLPQLDEERACHGLAVLLGGTSEPTPDQVRALVLARSRLYQQLADGLAQGTWEGEALIAARRYAARDARRASGAELTLLESLRLRLTPPVHGDDPPRALLIAMEPEAASGQVCTVDDWRSSVLINQDHELVALASQGNATARGLLEVEIACKMAVGQSRREALHEALVRLATQGE